MSTTEITAEAAGRELSPQEQIALARAEYRPRTTMAEHALYLALASLVVGLAFALGVPGEGEASGKVMVPLLNVPMPSLCQFKNLTGIDCPGCGMTRAFIRIAHGQIVSAWWLNPASYVLFAFIAAQIPYRAVQLWRMSRGQNQLYWPTVNRVAVTTLMITLISQWLVKLSWALIHWA